MRGKRDRREDARIGLTMLQPVGHHAQGKGLCAPSATQLYRLLDPANTTKSLDRMIDLLHVLGCSVDIVVKDRARRR